MICEGEDPPASQHLLLISYVPLQSDAHCSFYITPLLHEQESPDSFCTLEPHPAQGRDITVGVSCSRELGMQ